MDIRNIPVGSEDWESDTREKYVEAIERVTRLAEVSGVSRRQFIQIVGGISAAASAECLWKPSFGWIVRGQCGWQSSGLVRW